MKTYPNSSPYQYGYFTYYDRTIHFPSVDAITSVLIMGLRPIMRANPSTPVPDKHYEFTWKGAKVEFTMLMEDKDVLWVNVFKCFEKLDNIFFGYRAEPVGGVCDVLEGYAAIAKMTVRPVAPPSRKGGRVAGGDGDGDSFATS